MLWSAACQTVGSVAVGSLLHCGKLSPVGATALSETFSDHFKGQNTEFSNVHLNVIQDYTYSEIVNSDRRACRGHRKRI